MIRSDRPGPRRPPCRSAGALLLSALLAACAPDPGAGRNAGTRRTQAGPAQAAPTPFGDDAAAAAPQPAPAAPASGDDVAAALSLYLRLLQPNGGTPAELAGFLQAHPDWPNRPLLRRRLDQALVLEVDPSVLSALCPRAPLAGAAVLARCATAVANPTADPVLAAAARRAWVAGIDTPDEEALFALTWRGVQTPADQEARFARQEAAGALDAAARTAALLPPGVQARALVELALRRDDPDAATEAAALPAAQRDDPVLLIELSRWLRRAGRLDQALALCRGRGGAAEASAPAAIRARAWGERDALARALLDNGQDGDAIAVAADPNPLPAASQADAAFLAGWIALRRLHDPARAQQWFAPLAQADAVITRSRGEYWLGRARAAAGDAEGAAAWFGRAARSPTSFYGQLAIARLDPAHPQTLADPSLDRALLAAPIAAVPQPRWSAADAVRFAGLDLARAAELLVAWNDPRHARAFLLALDGALHDDTGHALAASLALRLGLPDVSVAIARAAGRSGQVLAGTGWPRPFSPPDADGVAPALSLAVMRQESSFDPDAVSPAGACGLMQLTPGSALDIARRIGRPELAADRNALFDPAGNMALGTAYLSSLLVRFGGVVPYALAGYNAGPHRADRWLALHGDPAHAPPAGGGPGDDGQALLLDWIELIPFAETRNYVERVMESRAIYAEPPG